MGEPRGLLKLKQVSYFFTLTLTLMVAINRCLFRVVVELGCLDLITMLRLQYRLVHGVAW